MKNKILPILAIIPFGLLVIAALAANVPWQLIVISVISILFIWGLSNL